jgi:anti-anti-sigma factor
MPAIPFRVDVRGSREIATVGLHGDIDARADQLGDAYASVAALHAAKVLLDFTDAAYINSTGIAIIVEFLAAARRDGREVLACGLDPHYVEVFRITRLSDYVRLVDVPTVAATAMDPGAGSETGR